MAHRKTGKSERRPLLDVLREHPAGISPEDLMAAAGFEIRSVEDFYRELATIRDHLTEKRPSKSQSRKWPHGAKIVLNPKGVAK